MSDGKIRCGWVNESKPHYVHYHDHEWGVPLHGDQKLFEMLILEGAQAGLSWETILKRRDNYRAAFKDFDIAACAAFTDEELEARMSDEGIIRNRLKIWSVRKNALAFIAIQTEFGSFDAYLWRFVDGAPKLNRPQTLKDVPASTPESDALSKDLKKRGMSFVGSTILYAYMQAVGLVDDHVATCFKAAK
ncbi:DNA-3-methyladenine glycosylase I [Asticcacaulis sp. YBE204]|uniref:DNA-3-methyladenine glycosylase I n=1 Tax=Asticcacaulis sp. YBE204 TaxID=1282363 RepID=UPI0003C3C494|nr:DNA-3-methyladenine glycosylase I [Asticcacaulis sp. YBE204]ESQ77953.1 DNA-3-methyladenine glycosylase [Asticcacaulis sp. YBE204]